MSTLDAGEDVRVIHGDCLEILPTLGRDDFGAIVTDPPYGINVCNRADGGVSSVSGGGKVYGRTDWDKKPPPPELFTLLLSFDVPTIIWGGNYFPLPPSPSWLIWDKEQREFSFADAEMAWTNTGKATRIFGCARGRLVAEGKKHPTQKPLSLMLWCLSFLPKGCTVIDPYAGSGTTGVACLKTGRKCILIERDPRYIPVIHRRLRDAATPLFDPVSP